MKFKELYIEAKRSKSYQTVTVGRLITIEEGDDVLLIEQNQQKDINLSAENMLKETLK